MSMKVTMNIKGAEEIKQRLNMMQKEVAGEHLREVALEAAEIIRSEAEARAPRRTGTLASDIHKELDEKEVLGTRVKVKIGPGKKGWYGRLVEMGHKIVRGRRKAEKQVVGYAPPKPWLRPAFDATKKKAQEHMIEEFKRRLGL